MAFLATRFGGHNSCTLQQAPLSDDEIMRLAPSVFAEDKHASRSARYAYIPTIDILRGLRREGFEAFFALQSSTRKEGQVGYTKHLLRLRHRDHVGRADVNEVILINSHNGSSGYQMLGGAFRSVCTNSLVCGDVVEDIRIAHKGDVQQEVISGAFRLLDQFERIDEAKDSFRALELSSGEQMAFARAALVARFDVQTPEDAPLPADELLTPRRYDDRGSDLWRTFNRVQENVIQGGLRTRVRDVDGRVRRGTTRPIAGIDQNTTLNRALWTLAEGLRAARIAA